jgi:hypothetical protein
MTRSSLRAPAALLAARRSPDSPDCRQTGRDLRRVRVDREQYGTEHDTVVAVELAVQVLDELFGCSLRVLAAPGGDSRACPIRSSGLFSRYLIGYRVELTSGQSRM